LAPLVELALAGESACLEAVPAGNGDSITYWDLTVAPLLQGGEVTGVLTMTRDVTARVRVLQSLEQVAEESRRDVEQQRQLAAGLRDILAVLNSDRPLEEVLDYIVAQASHLLGADATVLHQIEHERKFVAIAASSGLPEALQHLEGLPLYAGKEDRKILNRQPVVMREIKGPELAPLADAVSATVREWRDVIAQRYRSWMAVPLVVGDDVYGSLAFYYQRQRELTDDEVVLATTFADQAALAIENARLYNQAEQLAVVRERERLARELHDSITQTLYSLTLLAEAGQRLAGAGQLERVRGYLEEMSGLAQQTLREMRLLVYELRPLVLKREGLVGALQHRLDSVEKRAGVKARLLVEGPLELPAGIE
jgi:two-component system nitrate/nitrite sensor histidine kinase NarX